MVVSFEADCLQIYYALLTALHKQPSQKLFTIAAQKGSSRNPSMTHQLASITLCIEGRNVVPSILLHQRSMK